MHNAILISNASYIARNGSVTRWLPPLRWDLHIPSNVKRRTLNIGSESIMASIVKDEPNARRLRDISLELSRMGMDDELLRDVLMKARERRTRTHPSPTPQPIGSNRVGLGHGAEKKHAPLNAVQTKRHSAGMHAKSRQTHLFRDGSLNKNKASGRTAAFPKQRNSESFGSIYSLHLSNRTREDQVSGTRPNDSILCVHILSLFRFIKL